MKIIKTKNRGDALVAILIFGTVLLTTGYFLYDQLIFSNKMTVNQVYKNQLSLHNISIADTIQTILNVVVEDKTNDNEQVELFHKDRKNKKFIVADKKLFSNSTYIRTVYKDKKYGVELDKLNFTFKICNFINTRGYDPLFVSNNGNDENIPFEEYCPRNGTKDKIISEVNVSFRGDNILVDVRSYLPKERPYNGLELSSSFSLPIPPNSTDCKDYVEIVNNRIALTSEKEDKNGNAILHEQVQDEKGSKIDYYGYVTFPGFNIDDSIPYKFLISRYGGTNLSSEECVEDGFNNKVCKASFSIRTHYHSRNKSRFTTYMYAKNSMAMPTGKENFWVNPREYEGCNNVFPIDGSTYSRHCDPVTDPDIIESTPLGDGGWSDTHTFTIKYIKRVDGEEICSLSRKTVSGLTPGVRQDGCFDENTLLEDNLGNKIKIKDLSMGVTLKNPVTNDTVRVIRTVAGPENKELIEIVTEDNNSILVTQDHPFKTGRGLISADKVEKSDILFNEKGSLKIRSIKKVSSNNRMVYNFMVRSNKKVDSDEDHYVIANGIVSGDLYLQNKLKYKNSLVVK